MSKRTKARFKAYRAKQEKAALRLVVTPSTPSLVVVTGTPSLRAAWAAPVVREMFGAEAEIRRAYARFSPDHPCHRHEPDYADDYLSEGARVLTWVPPVTALAMREAA
jgi:hypothetical protein